MSEKMFLEFLETYRYGKVDVAFDYGDSVISGRLVSMSMSYIDLPERSQVPHNVVKIEGYPYPMIIPFRSALATVKESEPGVSEGHPIAFDTADYKREYLGKWVKINGIKTGKLIGRVHTEELKEEMNRLVVKDTYVFDSGETWVCQRSHPVES